MEPLQILERYFNTFIGLDDPKDFFIGMTDYLNYGDVLPEFDLITTQISGMPRELTSRYEAQQKTALEKVATAHKEITAYVAKKKIEHPGIKNALKEYGDFVEKRAFSSSPLSYTLHDELHDALEILYALPEHKEFRIESVELRRFLNRTKTS